MKRSRRISNEWFRQMRLLVLNTDIRILVIAPPIIGFGGFFVWLLVMEVLTKGSTSQASFEIGLGLACLVECIAGCAEIYKQEMPGAFGKIVTGKIAVGSGLLIVTIFGLAGIYILGSGLIKLFSS